MISKFEENQIFKKNYNSVHFNTSHRSVENIMIYILPFNIYNGIVAITNLYIGRYYSKWVTACYVFIFDFNCVFLLVIMHV